MRLGIFIDLSEVFDSVDYEILTSRLKEYHCVKTVFIRSFSGAYFPALGPEKLRIRTFFTQCTRLEEIIFNGLDTISLIENSSLNAET